MYYVSMKRSKKNGDRFCVPTYRRLQISGIFWQAKSKQIQPILCIFVKNIIHFHKLEWLHEFAVEESFECCSINIPESKTIMVCLYWSGKNMSIFIERLDCLLFKFTRNHRYLYKKIVLEGHFNINLFENDNITSRFLKILSLHKTDAEL